jgi:hypothetical protein
MASTLGNGNITFGDSTSQSTAAGNLGGASSNMRQPSRSGGTTYTNSNGKAIWVSVSCPSSGTGQMYVNGILSQYSIQDSYPRVCVCAVVPIGATYSYSGPGFNYWCEVY